jgi:hypothetical protein
MEDLLRLILTCLGFSDVLLLLDRDLACPHCVTLVLTTEKAEELPGLITEPSSTEASSSCLLELAVCKKFAACPKTVSYDDCSEYCWSFHRWHWNYGFT